MALGPTHLAVGINNNIWFYLWTIRGGDGGMMGQTKLAFGREFFGPVKQVCLNSRCTAILSEQRIILHSLHVDPKQPNADDRRFPINDHEKGVSQVALTEQFLIYANTQGKIFFFLIDDNQLVAQHHPENIVSKIYPNKLGTKCVCIDNTGNGYLYNAVSNTSCLVPNFRGDTQNIIWDIDDSSVFITHNKNKLNTYLYQDGSLDGGVSVIHVPEYLNISDIGNLPFGAQTSIHSELKPLILKNGYVYCQSSSEKILGATLATHSYLKLWPGESDTEEGHFRYFCQNLALNRYSECFKAAKFTEEEISKQLYQVLGRQCLRTLETEKAERAYQMCANTGMAMAISSIKHQNEKLVLMGYVSMFLRRYDAAQEFFLKSSRPKLAVQMRNDLQDWQFALRLAGQLSPEQEPRICRKYAEQLENHGKYIQAKKHFDQAYKIGEQILPDSQIQDPKHAIECLAGIARTSARIGDITKAVNIAEELDDLSMLTQIANVCQQMKQYGQSARLYERIQNWQKAAMLYIESRQIRQAERLADKVTSSKILSQLGKAKEATKQYRQAERYYERAKAWDDVIRINLEELQDFDKAKKIMKVYHPTLQSAEMIAQFCNKKGLKRQAIEFYFHSGQRDRAFEMAKQSQEMQIYSNLILNPNSFDDNHDEHLRVAGYFQAKDEQRKAAKHYERCENYAKALNLYIEAGEDAIDDAIQMVGSTRNENHIEKLGDYLLGEHDGQAHDPKLTIKLYRMIGKIKQATRIAVSVADQEQELGNYKYTHQLLFDAFRYLRENQLTIPFDLNHKITILHSYVLARHMLKLTDHKSAARLLLRVAKNVSQFPVHSSKILTSTVKECALAKFKKAAYEQAVILQRPENLKDLEPNYQKKIQNLAKNQILNEDQQEKAMPCPFCKTLVPEYETMCYNCKMTIPFCLASGKHIVKHEYCECPRCRSPAILSEFKRILAVTPECPMCNTKVNEEQVVLSSDLDNDIKKYTLATDQEEEGQEEHQNSDDENNEDHHHI